MFPIDILQYIVSYMNEFQDVMSWRHTCRRTFITYTVSFYCSRMYTFIRTPYVLITKDTNLDRLSKRTYINGLVVNSTNKPLGNKHLCNLKNLFSLKISTSYPYSSIDAKAFKNFNKLKAFICSRETFVNDEVLMYMPDLIYLDCTACLHVTGKSLGSLHHLTTLICEDIYDLDFRFLTNLTNLKSLTIHQSVQNDINIFKSLTNLTTLNLSPSMSIKPEIVKLLPNLDSVICGNYEYTDDHLMHLNNLKMLICGINCFFTSLSISRLQNLTVLNINNGVFNITDSALINLTNLLELHCGILYIPDYIFKYYTELRILNCDSNILMSDTALEYLPKLISLNCGKNLKFTDIGLSKLHKLRYLNCGINRNFREELFKISKRLNVLEITIHSQAVVSKEFDNVIKRIKKHMPIRHRYE